MLDKAGLGRKWPAREKVRVTSIIFDSFTLQLVTSPPLPPLFPLSFFFLEELNTIKFHGCKLHASEQRFFD